MHAVQAYLEQVWGDAAARFTLVAQNPSSSTPQDTSRDENGRGGS
jgi:hypothetical protein